MTVVERMCLGVLSLGGVLFEVKRNKLKRSGGKILLHVISWVVPIRIYPFPPSHSHALPPPTDVQLRSTGPRQRRHRHRLPCRREGQLLHRGRQWARQDEGLLSLHHPREPGGHDRQVGTGRRQRHR